MHTKISPVRAVWYGLVTYAVLVIFVGVFAGKSSIASYMDLVESEKVLSSAIGDLRWQANKTQDEVRKLSESPAYASRLLKEKYHVMASDEQVIFFAD